MSDPAERAAERISSFIDRVSRGERGLAKEHIADIIRAEFAEAVEAAREACVIRALNLTGALDRKVNEARLAELLQWHDPVTGSVLGSYDTYRAMVKRIAELKAALESQKRRNDNGKDKESEGGTKTQEVSKAQARTSDQARS